MAFGQLSASFWHATKRAFVALTSFGESGGMGRLPILHDRVQQDGEQAEIIGGVFASLARPDDRQG
jgi:hypothetical protein